MENIAKARGQFAARYHGEQNETTLHGTALGLVNPAIEHLDHAQWLSEY